MKLKMTNWKILVLIKRLPVFQKNKIKDFLVGQKEEDKIKKKTTEAKQKKI